MTSGKQERKPPVGRAGRSALPVQWDPHKTILEELTATQVDLAFVTELLDELYEAASWVYNDADDRGETRNDEGIPHDDWKALGTALQNVKPHIEKPKTDQVRPIPRDQSHPAQIARLIADQATTLNRMLQHRLSSDPDRQQDEDSCRCES